MLRRFNGYGTNPRAGCRNGAELWRRLRNEGFQGSLRVVGEWATRRRRLERAVSSHPHRPISARTVARLMSDRDYPAPSRTSDGRADGRHDDQDPEASPAGERAGDEVQPPSLARSLRRRHRSPHSERPFATAAPPATLSEMPPQIIECVAISITCAHIMSENCVELIAHEHFSGLFPVVWN